jgi:hypothetical protein
VRPDPGFIPGNEDIQSQWITSLKGCGSGAFAGEGRRCLVVLVLIALKHLAHGVGTNREPEAPNENRKIECSSLINQSVQFRQVRR